MGAWNREDDKAFEIALATEGDEKRWEEIAAKVPGKTAGEVKVHYEVLVEDLRAIETGKVTLPSYVRGKRRRTGIRSSSSNPAAPEIRRGAPWGALEDSIPAGDWRSISRNFVISRTPTQVASHAQKYFIRLNSMNRDRRRASIHDITSVNNGDVASPHVPITGQMNPAMVAAVGQAMKHPGHPHPTMPAMGIYGPAVGQPTTGHMMSAVGTPVMRPSGHPSYVIPVAYPVPPPTMHP
ncbi:unnamed protein product [Spirodela intermedia]|uniref:Uncharacterized protein n=1 Tax=Spirodela intermedia TaxID=51605 RepID=A0A7I8J4X6_SPIIN|nr:unnamed protein product [Spirodela intermedia]CAA6665286.1 unnamed protein product [Spirodela intermedia]